MAYVERQIRAYGSLGLLLVVVAIVASVAVTSCGSGNGGKSNGALCEQCGDDPDGPCQPRVEYTPDASLPLPCNSPVPGSTRVCIVELICRRKSDSAQQRCYPGRPGTGDVNYQWRCDGSRPGGTARPEPSDTPGPTNPTATRTAVTNSCGNGTIEGFDECDGNDLGGGLTTGTATCEDFDCLGTGQPFCSSTCTLNLSGCTCDD